MGEREGEQTGGGQLSRDAPSVPAQPRRNAGQPEGGHHQAPERPRAAAHGDPESGNQSCGGERCGRQAVGEATKAVTAHRRPQSGDHVHASIIAESPAGRFTWTRRDSTTRRCNGFGQYHEPPEELPQETRTFARLCASLTEEAEAIGWYEQRIAVERDPEAVAVMRDAVGEEVTSTSPWTSSS